MFQSSALKGFSFQNPSKHFDIGIIGSEGSGKRITMKIIMEIIKEAYPDCTFEFYDPIEMYDYQRNKEMTIKELKAIENKTLSIRIIVSPNSTYEELEDYFVQNRLDSFLTIIVLNTYQYNEKIKIFVNRMVFFENYTKQELKAIMKKRIEKTLEDNSRLEEIDQGLNEIITHSKYNLKYVYNVFEKVYKHNSDLNETLEYFEELRNLRLSTKDKKLIDCFLSEYFNTGISTTALVKQHKYNRTIAWNYLERLVKKKVFTLVKYSKPSIYGINKDFLLVYEERKRKDVIENLTI